MLKKIAQKIYSRFQPKPRSGEAFVNFKNRGIINFIDIGSVGDLPHPWYPNATFILNLLKFEPRDIPSKNPFVRTVSIALWNKTEERDFYIYKGLNSSGSSLFQQNFTYVKDNFDLLSQKGEKWLADTWFERSELIKTEKIQCKALDKVLEEMNNNIPYHFIKIDAQGAEYEILKGSEKVLSNTCIGLHLELFNIPLYKDIKLLPEVEAYLKNFDLKW